MQKRFIKYAALFLIFSILTGCANAESASNDYVSTVIDKEIVSEAEAAEISKTPDTTEAASAESPDVADNTEESQEEVTQESQADTQKTETAQAESGQETGETFELAEIAEYSGEPYVVLNDNQPWFTSEELVTTAFENYSELDSLGRCGVAYANICQDIMPTEERGRIGEVRPSGWHTVKYNELIDGNYLYNRCHLIGYQLAGENANEKNLITGTRYLNVEGMLPFENMVDDYVEETDNHVLYRVTPVFDGNNLVASGVIMEAESVEDGGKGICYNVYVYNVQPGILIDYATGDSEADPDYTGTVANESSAESETQKSEAADADAQETTAYPEGCYVLNTNTHKFHKPSCSSVSDMQEKNTKISTESREQIISDGYSPCKRCNP